MAATLNFEIKKHLKYFRLDDDPGDKKAANKGKSVRFEVLTYFLLCSNGRLRCWPSIDQITDDLAINREMVCKAVSWLVSRKAVCLVPYDKRIGAEKKLHNRAAVYQLTGIIQFTDMEPVQYLYMRPGEMKEVIDELNGMDNRTTAAILAEFCPDPEAEKKPEKSEVQSPSEGLSQSPPKSIQSPSEGLSQSPPKSDFHYIELESSKDDSSTSSSSSKEVTRAGEKVIDEMPEKEEDDEDHPETEKIISLYVQNMPGTLTPFVRDTIVDAIEEFGHQRVKEALEQAILHNARNWAYIDKILQTWKIEGKPSGWRRVFPSPSSAPPPPGASLRPGAYQPPPKEPEWLDEAGKADPDGAFQMIEGKLHQMRRLKAYRHLLTMKDAENATAS